MVPPARFYYSSSLLWFHLHNSILAAVYYGSTCTILLNCQSLHDTIMVQIYNIKLPKQAYFATDADCHYIFMDTIYRSFYGIVTNIFLSNIFKNRKT
jgi:hypothetical protein